MGRLDGRRGGEHPRRGARVSTELGAERFRGEGGRGRDVVLERREFTGGLVPRSPWTPKSADAEVPQNMAQHLDM